MTLSVCMLTSEPAARVQAILGPLRALADEIVVAADARVDDETLAGYAAIADRLERIEFRTLERHLGWLHAQCSGDWILRLDGDELPSAALVARLPELLESRTVDHYRIAQAWLYPDARTVLDGPPWTTDFVNRLVRATPSLRFDGRLHQHAATPGPYEHVTEPTYHLSLLLADADERRAKAVRYEVDEPHLRVAGGRFNEAYFMPELRSTLELREVPAEDRALIAQGLRPDPPATVPLPAPIELTPAAEVACFWEGRTSRGTAYRARIEPVRDREQLVVGEQRRLLLHVTNDGDELWPWSLEHRPRIRLSYHWLKADGSMAVYDGLRTPFPAIVNPGDRVLAGLDVLAPDEPGDYVLDVDLVHDLVRWFECDHRIPVSVVASSGLPDVGERLRVTRAPRLPGARRTRIPRIIHRVWLGPAEMPRRDQAFGESFAAHHPGWEMRLWTDADLASLDIGETEQRHARTRSELSNRVRYEILSRHGGVYVDTDVECRRSFEPLLRGTDAFAALELPGRVGTAVLGSVPGQRAFARAARESGLTLGLGAHSPDANGPYFLSLILEQEPNGVRILPQETFYPYLWTEPERAGEPFPDAYAVHHWAASWLRQNGNRPATPEGRR